MARKLLLILFLNCFLISSAWAGINVDYNDINCQGAYLMEDVGSETDEAQGNDLSESGGTIPRDADRKFGDWSRDFEQGDTEFLTHADGLSTDINGVDQKMSALGWVKMEDDNTSVTIIAKYNFGAANQRQYLLQLGGTSEAAFSISNDGTAFNIAIAGTIVGTGAWHHIAGVYNDIDIRVYLDGVLDTSANNPQAHTTGINNSTAIFQVGALLNNNSPNNFFDGLIDDAGVFDRDLSSTEINDIMDNGLAPVAAAGQVIIIS